MQLGISGGASGLPQRTIIMTCRNVIHVETMCNCFLDDRLLRL